MLILRFSIYLTLPLALCLTSCTGDNSENILTEMDEVVPQESFITFRGASSATSEGLGFVCSENDLTTEAVIAGDELSGSTFVLERKTFPGGVDDNLITLLIEEISTSENGDTAFLSTNYAFCVDCLTSFENTGSTMEGEFTGEFFQTDLDGNDSPYGEISGSFNVLIDTSFPWCQ